MTEDELCKTMNELSAKVLGQCGERTDPYELLMAPVDYWGKFPLEAFRNGRYTVGTITSDLGLRADLILDPTCPAGSIYLQPEVSES